MTYIKPPPADSLWAAPPSHRNAPETSRQAADRIAPTAATLRAKVLDAILAAPDGMTDEEQQNALGMNGSTQRPRRGELVAAQLVADSGRRRKTRSGAMAVVWTATERARGAE